MATERSGSAVWQGDLMNGSGTIAEAPTGAFGPLDVSWAARAEDADGKTSPEELLAAAHATCWVTSLGSELARLGTPPERMHVRCTITMDEVEGQGHRIVASAINASATVPGADEARLAEAAAAADAGCPFSALIRATATVTYDASLEG
jgi:osmotically inducible protein OsmC